MAITVPMTWWKRCIKGALLNGCVWLTPPPMHFAALFMPFITGYSIAFERRQTSMSMCLAIGAIMAATLGGAVMLVGFICIAVASFIIDSVPMIYPILTIIIGCCIGSYTGIASFTGAIFGRANAHTNPSLSS
jgi:hypothetical protein